MENFRVNDNRIICFIILHYIGLEETINCVNSILSLEKSAQVKIVIVDNASPNGSGKRLQEIYKSSDNINVLLRDKNDGFSKANNDAVDIARRIWSPDFYVVTNNDILFSQNEFVELILKSYDEYEFDILGPDIYVPQYAAHQNPMQKKPPSLIQVEFTIIKNSLGLIFFPLLRKYIAKKHAIGICQSADGYYRTFSKNVCLKGACLIFSRKYVEEKDKLFYPETYFYYEEFIQAVYCEWKNKVVIYNPKLRIVHLDGVATEKDNKGNYTKNKYIVKNTLAAAKVYRNMLLRGKDNF